MLMCGFIAACSITAGGNKLLPVQIPQDCEQLAADVPVPDWQPGVNPKVVLGRTTAALIEANDNLAATRACQRITRETFAGRSN